MFLDTADAKLVQNLLNIGLFQGITTNPTLLKREKISRFRGLKEISRQHPKMLFVQLQGDSAEELYQDFTAVEEFFASEETTYGLKISINLEGLKVMSRVKETNPDIQILGTAIYSADQAILAATAGCDYVAPYMKRMENAGIDPYETVRLVRTYLDREELSCKIMGASFKDASQAMRTLESGAHTLTVSPAVVEEMAEKAIANDAIEVFNQHGKELENFE